MYVAVELEDGQVTVVTAANGWWKLPAKVVAVGKPRERTSTAWRDAEKREAAKSARAGG